MSQQQPQGESTVPEFTLLPLLFTFLDVAYLPAEAAVLNPEPKDDRRAKARGLEAEKIKGQQALQLWRTLCPYGYGLWLFLCSGALTESNRARAFDPHQERRRFCLTGARTSQHPEYLSVPDTRGI